MGRRKLKMGKIEDPALRIAKFKIRYKGVLKKASELSTLCDVDVGVIIFSPNGPPEVFGSKPIEALVTRLENWDSGCPSGQNLSQNTENFDKELEKQNSMESLNALKRDVQEDLRRVDQQMHMLLQQQQEEQVHMLSQQQQEDPQEEEMRMLLQQQEEERHTLVQQQQEEMHIFFQQQQQQQQQQQGEQMHIDLQQQQEGQRTDPNPLMQNPEIESLDSIPPWKEQMKDIYADDDFYQELSTLTDLGLDPNDNWMSHY